MKFYGQTALVTGGTRGIGRAIALKLLEYGVNVIITGRKNSDANLPQNCSFMQIDFNDINDVQKFANIITDLPIDILINNAGINKISPFEDISLSDFQNILQVNLITPFLLCKACIPRMKRQSWGRIITISSVFGKVSKELRASYSSSKFAVDGMTAALSAEVSQYGILANCVSPGFIDTELTRSVLGESGIKEIKNKIPIGRLGQSEEIAELVAWLVSPQNTYVTGQNYAIDGGFTRV